MRRPTRTAALLQRLPNSWTFAAFWLLALGILAVGAARAA